MYKDINMIDDWSLPHNGQKLRWFVSFIWMPYKQTQISHLRPQKRRQMLYNAFEISFNDQ